MAGDRAPRPRELAEKVPFIDDGDSLLGYVGPLVFGTVLAALIALVIATPVAIGVALFISHYAPRKLAQVFGYVVDLLAAIPSVVYGLWGALWLMPKLSPFFVWLSHTFALHPALRRARSRARRARSSPRASCSP